MALTVFAGWQPQLHGQTIVLGSASNFAILAGSGITIAGAPGSSAITGDLGTFPTPTVTGLGNVVLTGTNHGGDAVTQAAKAALVIAYNTAAGLPAATVGTELGGTTKGPGVYDSASTTFGITGILTLDAGGNPNAVFIFKMASTLTTAASSEVKLINGAQANNVFWQVGSSATLGSSSIFKGNILALTAITMGTGATVDGRLLARNSFTQLDGSDTLRIAFTAQTITFGPIAARTACDGPFTFVLPVATSGLPVTVAVSGPATVSGNTITLTGVIGTVILTASQAGDGTYAPAPSVVQSFAVGACALTSQTIAFAAIAGHTACDAPFTVNPTASSGLAVTLAVASGPATVSGNTVTLTGAGTVVLTTSQAGNGTFAAATNVTQSFVVTACAVPPTAQTITFAAIAGHTACDAPFTVTATSSSGLPVTLTVASGPATISGNTATPTGAGTVVLTASQAGNGTYAAATNVTQSFVVTACAVPPTAQTITFAAIAGHTACDAPFTVTATSSSGLPVTLTVASGPATISGNTATPTGAGTVVLTASQAGNGTFAAATNVTQSFVVTACAVPPTAQTITFAAIAGHTACDAPFTVTATSSSGLPVTLTVTSGPATISGNTVTPTGAGTVVLTASQAGNGTFAAATSVTQSFVVTACVGTPTPQTITFPAIPAHTACDAPFTFVYPVASSGLTVTLNVSGPATISGGNVITLTGAGTVVLTATQVGNSTFTAAPTVVRSFAVGACGVLPVITSPFDVQSGGAPVSPNAQVGMIGTPFTYQITATGSPTSFSATNLPPGLSLNSLTGAITGTPTVMDTWFVTIGATNAAGTSTEAVIVTIAGGPSSRIVNFSARAVSGPGDQALVMGFFVSGNGKNLLVRGIGPSLTALGISNALADPFLTLSGAAGTIATNDDWQTPLGGQPDGV